MSLKDILGFDPAVQCHPLSLALCLILVFFSTSYPASLRIVILFHFAILSSLASFSLFHFRFLILFLLLLLLATISVSVSRTEEGSAPGNSFAETWHRTAKHEWYIYMAPREKLGEMDLLGKGLSSVTLGERRREEMRNVFFERNSLIHSRNRAEVRPQFLPSSASDEFSPSRAFGRGWKMCDVSLNATYFDAQQISVDVYMHIYHKNITHREYIQFIY